MVADGNAGVLLPFAERHGVFDDETGALEAARHELSQTLRNGQFGVQKFGENDGIVVGGARSTQGMPGVELNVEESEAVRNYVLSLSEEIRAKQ